MITILISENEEKTKELLSGLLKKDEPISPNTSAIATIEDKVIEIENTLHDGKKGELYKTILEAVEKPLFEQILKKTEGNQLKAARLLGINRNTIRAKIKKLKIDVAKWKAS